MNAPHFISGLAMAAFAAIAASAAHANNTCEIGNRMSDGTICAGLSPDTGKPMYALPKDAPLTMKWQEAMDYAARLVTHGHTDWKLPTEAELNVLYQNRGKGALKGTFDESGSNPAGYYWSSTEYDDFGAHGQMFSNGRRVWDYVDQHSSVRPVRSEPRP